MTPNQQNQVHEKVIKKHLLESSRKSDTHEKISHEIKERIRLINALMVQIFLDSKDVETHNLLPYIRHLVKRFRLNGDLCEFDILIETYTIAIRKTKEEYVIKNLPAWFKSTAFYIVSNLSREAKKQDLIKKKVEHDQQEATTLESFEPDEIVNDKIKCLCKAFTELREEDRSLLNLRVVEGLTWSDIAERMIVEGKEAEISTKLLARLRKRHQRALECLRNSYDHFS